MLSIPPLPESNPILPAPSLKPLIVTRSYSFMSSQAKLFCRKMKSLQVHYNLYMPFNNLAKYFCSPFLHSGLFFSYPRGPLYFATFIRNSLACFPPFSSFALRIPPPLSPLASHLHLIFPQVQSHSTENATTLIGYLHQQHNYCNIY
jgi:hypothetical protein